MNASAASPTPSRPATDPNRARLRWLVLAALSRDGCTFAGPVLPRHRRLARVLDQLDAERLPALRLVK